MIQEKMVKIGIHDLAQQLNVDDTIIQIWEKKFSIEGEYSAAGEKLYATQDIKKFKLIRQLLYEKKLSITQVKKYLQNKQKAGNNMQKPLLSGSKLASFFEQLKTLQTKLKRLRELI